MACEPITMVLRKETNILNRFATFLGSFRLKERDANYRKEGSKCLSCLFSPESEFSCSVPSLLLTSLSQESTAGNGTGSNHDSYLNHKMNQFQGNNGKDQVEEHASSNLARPLFSTTKNRGIASDSTNRNHTTTASTQTDIGDEIVTISEIPHLMLENLASSFLVLADARLRAYIGILARHGLSVSVCSALSEEEQREGVLAVERKLETLIKIGTGISIDNMVTVFHLQHSDRQSPTNSPLVIKATIDVCIPKNCGGQEVVTIEASAKGSITASFDSNNKLLTHIEVQVDTHELLAQLIDRASLVMSKALDIVRAVCTPGYRFPPAPLPKRNHVDFMMPPPKPVAVRVTNQRALVSPEVEPKREEPCVSPFQLDETISNLSPERCANIIDFVIGEVDHIIFPPLKRHKANA